MISQIAKAAANQIAFQDKIEQEWHDAKSSLEAAQWMHECSKGTKIEQDMLKLVEIAKEYERRAYAKVQAISIESRSLFNHYSNKLAN